MSCQMLQLIRLVGPAGVQSGRSGMPLMLGSGKRYSRKRRSANYKIRAAVVSGTRMTSGWLSPLLFASSSTVCSSAPYATTFSARGEIATQAPGGMPLSNSVRSRAVCVAGMASSPAGYRLLGPCREASVFLHKLITCNKLLYHNNLLAFLSVRPFVCLYSLRRWDGRFWSVFRRTLPGFQTRASHE